MWSLICETSIVVSSFCDCDELMVILPVRASWVSFSVMEIATSHVPALPVVAAGVIQVWSAVSVHATLDVMVMDVAVACPPRLMAAGVTLAFSSGVCVTTMALRSLPDFTMRLVVRVFWSVFADIVAVTVVALFFNPPDGDTLTHKSSLEMLQSLVAVIEKSTVCLLKSTSADSGVMVNVTSEVVPPPELPLPPPSSSEQQLRLTTAVVARTKFSKVLFMIGRFGLWL